MAEDPPKIVTTHGRTPPPELGPKSTLARAIETLADHPVESLVPATTGHPGIVEVFEDKADEWRFRVKGGNGEIVAASESYTRKHDTERGLHTLIDILRHPETKLEGFSDGR